MSPNQNKNHNDPLVESFLTELKQTDASVSAPPTFRKAIRENLLRSTAKPKRLSARQVRVAIVFAAMAILAINFVVLELGFRYRDAHPVVIGNSEGLSLHPSPLNTIRQLGQLNGQHPLSISSGVSNVSSGQAPSDARIIPIDPNRAQSFNFREFNLSQEELDMLHIMFWEQISSWENSFTETSTDNLSTFAVDVDTGSYSLAKRHIEEFGTLPPWMSIRPEEWINYFEYQYPTPDQNTFSIWMEGATTPYSLVDNAHLLHVGLQGMEVPEETRQDALLIFVIDTSGSMEREDRLELAKQSLNLLLDSLRPTDRIGIVTYSDKADILLEPTSADNKRQIQQAINQLKVEGSTNLNHGLQRGYELAEQFGAAARIPGQLTRLILVSDGVANVGPTSAEMILENAADGVALNTYGFGMNGYNDPLMEQLANQGDGIYAYIDTIEEAERYFVDGVMGTLVTIAKEMKVQVAFDPAVVQSYRLIGYDNRAVADADFRNDAVDGGEVGSGHSVTALYEVVFVEGAAQDAAAATVTIRYLDPQTNVPIEQAHPIWQSQFEQLLASASPQMQLAALVAESAETMRLASVLDDTSIEPLIDDAERVLNLWPNDEAVAEFVQLLIKAADRQ